MKKVLLCLFLFSSFLTKSQNIEERLWKAVRASSSVAANQSTITTDTPTYQLNVSALTYQLNKVSVARNELSLSNSIIYFPNEDGKLVAYKIAKAPVLSEAMQAKYPSVKSYIGESLDNPYQKIRFSNSPTTGLSATLFDKNGDLAFLQKKDNQYQIVNNKRVDNQPLQCNALQLSGEHHQHLNKAIRTSSKNSESNLKIFRLALLLGSDFSKEILDKLKVQDTAIKARKEEAIISYLNNLLTKLNAVFERDLAISMQLIENNESLLFLDTSKHQPSTNLNANQKIFDELIGSENYDIGHTLLLSNNEGVLGWSYVGSIGTSYKAGGFSTMSFNTGMQVLLHEMGHQLGASHTFNNISGKKTDIETSVEVGKGKTIMSYGQIATMFYHSASILQMKACIEKKLPNIKAVHTGNNKPVVDAGEDHTIPKQTPFLLEGKATDSNDKALSYSWEQIDKDIAIAPPSTNSMAGPLFAWKAPTEKASRLFPRLTTILEGKQHNENEALPAVSRSLNFTLIARDNNPNGGETDTDSLQIHVDENAGPFQITSHNKEKNIYVNEEIVLKWNVANTDKGKVNTKFVDILFSKDEAKTFPIEVALKVPNNGSHKFQATKAMETTSGRFMIKGHKNIFLDINDANIAVKSIDFLLTAEQKQKQICLEDTQTAIFKFTYQTNSNLSKKVHFQASKLGNANLTFSPSYVSENGTKVTLKITNLSKNNIGKNTIDITAYSISHRHNQQIQLNVFHDNLAPVTLLSPKDNTEGLASQTKLQWQTMKNATHYLLEVGESKAFDTPLLKKTIEANQFSLSDLKNNTTYYWRVKAYNSCGESQFSSIHHFATGEKHAHQTYIPDANFEKALTALGYDSGPLDNYVYTKNIDTVKELSVENYGIQDLTGIEDFKQLEVLSITNAYMKKKLKHVNLSGNKKLRVLILSNNNLEKLAIANLTDLQILICNQNNLKSIKIANNPKLKYLSCYGNQLDACSLNAIFTSLPKQQAKGEIFLKKYTLSNAGTTTCNTALLQGKNWEAKKYKDKTYSKLTGDGTGCSNHAPVADAGESFEIKTNSQVTLDASASYDIDGDDLHYEWTAPAFISLTDKNSATTDFTAPKVKVATQYEFQLKVSDYELTSEPARVTVTVLPTSFDGDIFQIKVESPACPNSMEGIVTLTNNSIYDFTIRIANQEQTIKAKATNTFTGLAAGEYPILCTLESDTTQKITDYIIVVPKPKMFTVTKQETQASTRSVNYVVEGATEYHLEVNHSRDIITFPDENPHLITVPLSGKESLIRIRPASSCKGDYYEEFISLDKDIKISPRISKNWVYIDGLNSEEVEITLITRKGNTVLRQKEIPIAGRCAFDISGLNDNIYFLNIKGKEEVLTTYIYKRTL